MHIFLKRENNLRVIKDKDGYKIRHLVQFPISHRIEVEICSQLPKGKRKGSLETKLQKFGRH